MTRRLVNDLAAEDRRRRILRHQAEPLMPWSTCVESDTSYYPESPHLHDLSSTPIT